LTAAWRSGCRFFNRWTGRRGSSLPSGSAVPLGPRGGGDGKDRRAGGIGGGSGRGGRGGGNGGHPSTGARGGGGPRGVCCTTGALSQVAVERTSGTATASKTVHMVRRNRKEAWNRKDAWSRPSSSEVMPAGRRQQRFDSGRIEAENGLSPVICDSRLSSLFSF